MKSVVNSKNPFIWQIIQSFLSIIGCFILSILTFGHPDSFIFMFFFIAAMIYYGNNKTLTLAYFVSCALISLCISVTQHKLFEIDPIVNEFLKFFVGASILCAGPFRLFVSKKMDGNIIFIMIVLSYLLTLKYISPAIAIFYASATAVTTFMLFIFRYKAINSIVLADAYVSYLLLEMNIGSRDYQKEVLTLIIGATILHSIISYLLSTTKLNSSELSLKTWISRKFPIISNNIKDYFNLPFIFLPITIGLSASSASIVGYLLFLFLIRKYTKAIEEFTYSSFKDLWDEPFEIDFRQYIPTIPEISFKIKLNLSFTIALIFIIIALLIRVCDV